MDTTSLSVITTKSIALSGRQLFLKSVQDFPTKRARGRKPSLRHWVGLDLNNQNTSPTCNPLLTELFKSKKHKPKCSAVDMTQHQEIMIEIDELAWSNWQLRYAQLCGIVDGYHEQNIRAVIMLHIRQRHPQLTWQIIGGLFNINPVTARKSAHDVLKENSTLKNKMITEDDNQ